MEENIAYNQMYWDNIIKKLDNKHIKEEKITNKHIRRLDNIFFFS